MTDRDAIRATLKAAKRPLTLRELLPRVEQKTKKVHGRARLYRLLSVLACTTDPDIRIDGRGNERTYALA